VALSVICKDAYDFCHERAGSQCAVAFRQRSACGGIRQAFHTSSDSRASCSSRTATPTAETHLSSQDALRSPGGPKPSAHHCARQCAGCDSRFLQALSRSAVPGGVQAGGHSFAHRIQGFPQSLHPGVQVSRFWSDHVADLVPYVPGEQPKVIDLLKLSTNENSYGPSPLAIKAMKAMLDDRLRRYPDPEALALRTEIAARYRVDVAQVFVGNGSDEVLAHIFHGLFLREGRQVLMPDITYSFYPTYCRLYHVPFETVPLAEDFSLRMSDYTDERARRAAGIIFANPNAPTGMALTLDEISQIAGANPDTVVVVDEAYV